MTPTTADQPILIPAERSAAGPLVPDSEVNRRIYMALGKALCFATTLYWVCHCSDLCLENMAVVDVGYLLSVLLLLKGL